ncbi:hypothetical protein FIBSPDRAFT_70477 [Athelia psychrophila]|uniref:Uncharacterized protein n=1 Tax=Athelia psychrophila TaxID=1759441 RepID=A0A166TUD2_9AGAM|nr:hypothetical protein FIBSPDRAFT_70477 [Fibularhizoctonia sp. CBS 109695]
MINRCTTKALMLTARFQTPSLQRNSQRTSCTCTACVEPVNRCCGRWLAACGTALELLVTTFLSSAILYPAPPPLHWQYCSHYPRE